ncbi:helix-turn-helix transcriptional regulator [Variovorax sp. LjRoot290]|uniref:helix-turn-helix transcriptional regulator n=1 Tax=unclassified Variovorax TaxID=663243 RepID=UPI003ECE9330
MNEIAAGSRHLPGFDAARWSAVESSLVDEPWQAAPHQVHRSSDGRTWRGLFVWHQIGPAGDLYVPPLSSHSILLRRSTPTALLQRHGSQVGTGPWRPGDALLVPAGRPSFWRSPATRDNIHINLDPAWLQRASGGQVRLRSCFGRRDPVLASFAQTLLASLDSNTSLRPMFAEHMALAIAVHLLEHYADPGPACGPALSRRQSDTLVDAVAAGLDESWPLARLAGLAGLSPFHFARAFKASFGATPHEYVCARRMEAAARLIRSTRKPLAEIAQATGYRSAAHFAQSFKRHWGVTPTAYRQGA